MIHTQVAAALSFMDPHVGAGHGWHTWARADGSKSLVAMPYDECPFEAYRPVFEDAGWTQMGAPHGCESLMVTPRWSSPE